MLVYLNGQYLDRSDAHLSIDERGVYFADGVYEVVRYFNGKAFTMAEHLDRLKRSLAGIDLPFDASEIPAISDKLVTRNGLTDAKVYWQITRGTPGSPGTSAPPRNHIYSDDMTPTVFLSVDKAPPLTTDAPLSTTAAITVPDERWHNCWIKSLMLLPNTLAKTKAHKAGAGEAIFIRDGRVTEGGATNCFAIFDGELYTHPADRFILRGITRNVVIELAKSLGIAVHEQAFNAIDLPAADEVFITGTGTLLAAITAVDGKPIADSQAGVITTRLWQAFIERVRQDCHA